LKGFHFLFGGPVSDGSYENKTGLTDFQLNPKIAQKKSILKNW